MRKILIASVAVATTTLGAPVAHADTPTFDCDFTAVQQNDVTGGSFEGVATGYVVHAGDIGATIRCYIKVNGVEDDWPPPTGIGFTSGRLVYSAGYWDVVTFHAEACTNQHGCSQAEYAVHRTPVAHGVIHGRVEPIDTEVEQVDSTFDCRLRRYRSALTGEDFDVAYGYLVHPGDHAATIRCYVRVNRGEAASTPTSRPAAPGVSVTADRLTYNAGDTDVVTFHAEVCSGDGRCFVHDYETQRIQVPPQEVIDAINAIAIEYVDPTICPILVALSGSYGPVVINEQGDVYVDGEPERDCPPYDIWPPA